MISKCYDYFRKVIFIKTKFALLQKIELQRIEEQPNALTSNKDDVLLHSYVENVPSLFFTDTKNSCDQ